MSLLVGSPWSWVREGRLVGSTDAIWIADVALAYGYADLAAFSRAFKTAFGCSPRGVVNDRGYAQHVERDVVSDWVKALR